MCRFVDTKLYCCMYGCKIANLRSTPIAGGLMACSARLNTSLYFLEKHTAPGWTHTYSWENITLKIEILIIRLIFTGKNHLNCLQKNHLKGQLYKKRFSHITVVRLTVSTKHKMFPEMARVRCNPFANRLLLVLKIFGEKWIKQDLEGLNLSETHEIGQNASI